jgi:hypothetical protein
MMLYTRSYTWTHGKRKNRSARTCIISLPTQSTPADFFVTAALLFLQFFFYEIWRGRSLYSNFIKEVKNIIYTREVSRAGRRTREGKS